MEISGLTPKNKKLLHLQTEQLFNRNRFFYHFFAADIDRHTLM